MCYSNMYYFSMVTTAFALFVILTLQEVRTHPLTDNAMVRDIDDAVDSKEGEIIDELRRRLIQSKETTEHFAIANEDDMLRRPVTYHKCKRNKRHVHPRGPPTDLSDNADNIAISGQPESLLSSSSVLSSAVIQDIEMQYHIERFKSKILEKLRLEQPPVITSSKPKLPPGISRKIQPDVSMTSGRGSTGPEREIDAITEDKHGQTKQIIVVAENDTCGHSESSLCFRFSPPSSTVIHLGNVTSASMWVYILQSDSNNDNRTKNRNMILTRQDRSSGNRSTIANKTIDNSVEGWVEVDIQDTHYMLTPATQHQQYIEVSILNDDGVPTSSGLSTLQMPTLALDVRSSSRATRSANHRTCQANTQVCCMQQFTVNFADIGWDFVIEPTEYVANYCRGSCTSAGPFTYDHSQVISLSSNRVRARNRGRSAALTAIEQDLAPCCAPEQLQSLDIMYLNANNQITVDVLPDMTVTSCGCA